MRDLTLLVLAAGIGKRYKGLKQIDPIGPSGEAILDYSVYDALRAGFSKIIFVIRKKIEETFHRAIGCYWGTRIPVHYVFQEIEAGLPESFLFPPRRQKPWGTGHAVLLSRSLINTPFAVINADDFYGPSALPDLAAWLRDRRARPEAVDEYGFIGYRLANTLSEFGYVSRGVCAVDSSGYLAEVVERIRIEKDGDAARMLDERGQWIPLRGEEIVSMNLWGFTPGFFAHLEKGFADFLAQDGQNTEAEYFIPFAVNTLIKARKARVKYIPTAEKCIGVTYPEDVFRLRSYIGKLISEGHYPEKIKQ